MTLPWESKTLAKVCEIKPAKSEARRKLKSTDVVSFVPMEDLGIDQRYLEPKRERKLGQVAGSYTYFADGDVLLAKITPCFENGKLGIARGLKNGIGFGSSEYIVFRPNASLSSEFLYYFLLRDSFRAEGIKTMGGAVGHKRVSKDFVERVRIPFPPLSEQQRIVAILDEVFAGLATTTANAEKNLKSVHELYNSQVSRKFDAVTNDNGSHRLGDIVSRLTNGYVGPTRNIYLEKGIPYLLARHVRDNHLEFDGEPFVSESFNEEHKKSKLKTGDVLLVQSGHIGHSAVVGAAHEGHNCHAMIVISPISDRLSGYFLSYFFGSPAMKRKFEEIRSGSTVPHLTCGLVKELMIPLPKLEHQQRVVAELDGLKQKTDKLAALAKAKISVSPA